MLTGDCRGSNGMGREARKETMSKEERTKSKRQGYRGSMWVPRDLCRRGHKWGRYGTTDVVRKSGKGTKNEDGRTGTEVGLERGRNLLCGSDL